MNEHWILEDTDPETWCFGQQFDVQICNVQAVVVRLHTQSWRWKCLVGETASSPSSSGLASTRSQAMVRAEEWLRARSTGSASPSHVSDP